MEKLDQSLHQTFYAQLNAIHRSVYDRFVYTTDKVRQNQDEHWENYDQIPETGLIYGDCDCFALACRRECRKQDIKSRLVYCLVPSPTGDLGHLVLESRGQILDNRRTKVVSNTQLNYKWILISGYERGEKWGSIIVPLNKDGML